MTKAQDYTAQYDEARDITCNRCLDTGTCSDGDDCLDCFAGMKGREKLIASRLAGRQPTLVDDMAKLGYSMGVGTAQALNQQRQAQVQSFRDVIKANEVNKNGDLFPKATLIVAPEAKHIELMRKTIKLLMAQPGDKTDETVQLIVELVAMVKGHEKGLTTAIEKQTGIGSAGRKKEDDELRRLAARLAGDIGHLDAAPPPLRDRERPPRDRIIHELSDTLFLVLKNLKG